MCSASRTLITSTRPIARFNARCAASASGTGNLANAFWNRLSISGLRSVRLMNSARTTSTPAMLLAASSSSPENSNSVVEPCASEIPVTVPPVKPSESYVNPVPIR